MGDYATYPDPTVLEIFRDLPGPIERVWDYLTKSELREKWLCAGEVSPEIGGEIVFRFDHSNLSTHPTPASHEGGGDMQMVGIIRAYEPPHHIAFSWPSREAEAPTEVVIRLREIDGKVRLHLRHEKIMTKDYKSGTSAGWHAHLDIMKDLLSDQTARDFWETFLALEQEYKAILAAG
ncbi:MAG: SRPBCC family protein [Pseudomonadota bacterium]